MSSRKSISMPFTVRKAFLMNSVISFLLSVASVAVVKSTLPRDMTASMLTAIGACLVSSGVLVLRYRYDASLQKNDGDGEFLVSLAAYAFSAFAAAAGAACASTTSFDRTFTIFSLAILALPAFLTMHVGIGRLIPVEYDAAVARKRLQLLPMMQIVCFYLVMAN